MPGESFQTTREAVAQASRRQETVERARAAREARAQAAAAAAKVEADQRDANAAEVVQCGARRWLESIRSRTSQRAAWVCPDHPPPAGQQLALAAWLLRFYEPRHDGGRLSQLCRLILAGLEEGAEAERAFCAAALSRPLTRHWVAVLHRLLLACARQLTPVGGALPAAGEGEGKGGEVVSGVLGPPLRLLLALAEPELWPFTRKLSAARGGSPAARALCLMTSATMSAAGGAVTSACGALVASLPLSLDRPLLGAATTVALLAAGIRAFSIDDSFQFLGHFVGKRFGNAIEGFLDDSSKVFRRLHQLQRSRRISTTTAKIVVRIISSSSAAAAFVAFLFVGTFSFDFSRSPATAFVAS